MEASEKMSVKYLNKFLDKLRLTTNDTDIEEQEDHDSIQVQECVDEDENGNEQHKEQDDNVGTETRRDVVEINSVQIESVKDSSDKESRCEGEKGQKRNEVTLLETDPRRQLLSNEGDLESGSENQPIHRSKRWKKRRRNGDVQSGEASTEESHNPSSEVRHNNGAKRTSNVENSSIGVGRNKKRKMDRISGKRKRTLLEEISPSPNGATSNDNLQPVGQKNRTRRSLTVRLRRLSVERRDEKRSPHSSSTSSINSNMSFQPIAESSGIHTKIAKGKCEVANFLLCV